MTYLKAALYNKAKVAFQSFLDGVSTSGVPSRIRVDTRVENGVIKRYVISANGKDKGSIKERRTDRKTWKSSDSC